jgi:nitrous oxide reductase accessory protein NosL
MRKLYGIRGADGELVVSREKSDGAALLVVNPSAEADDWTSPEGERWIEAGRLAAAFAAMVRRTGMTKQALAAWCGVDPATFSRYLGGRFPVPAGIWKRVEERLPR